MEVFRLVEIPVVWFVRASAAPICNPLGESFPLPVCADPPLHGRVAKSALTRRGLAIVRARQGVDATTGRLFVEFVPAMADSFPLPREAADLGGACSFSAVCYPVEEEEKRTLGVKSSRRRESVAEQMRPHRDLRVRAVVKA